MGKVKTNVLDFLRKCGFRNPISYYKEKKNMFLFKKYNKKLSNVDYFEYEKLLEMPNVVLRAPYGCNINYGLCNPVKTLYGGNVDLNYDYIEHGLFYAEAAPLLIRFLEAIPIGRIFTFSERRKGQVERVMAKAGFHNEVVALGPLILGAKNFHSKEELKEIKKKIGKTLLVFPMHSWTGVDNEFDKDELVQEIERLKSQFDTIMVCLYYMDIQKGMHKPFKEKGYTIVCNGSRFDMNFISRHRDIIELSDVTMSNGIGTHIGYSIALNRPHYYFKQNMEQTIDPSRPSEIPEQEFRIEFEKDFVKTFGEFSYEITEEQKQFVRYYWGEF